MSVEARAAAAQQANPDGNLDTVARLGAQRRKFKDATKRLTVERDEMKAKVDDLTKQLDEVKKSAPAEKIKELEGRIRDTLHRGKFDELAREAGVKPKALQDLWERSGYKAEGDAPNEAAMKAAIEAQRQARDYLFGEVPGAADGTNQAAAETAPIVKPGPGRGQGGTATNDSGPFGITQDQLRDPQWCFQNQAKIAAAATKAANLPKSQVAQALAIL